MRASQWRYGEWNECCASSALPFTRGGEPLELEVLEIWEESNEVQDLSARASGLAEGKELER